MLLCTCGWNGFDLIPHPDGTARCPDCLIIFKGIKAEDAIHDLDTIRWLECTRKAMKLVNGSWVLAWNHYMRFKPHYDKVRELDRNKLCPATGKSRVWSDGVTVTMQCLWGECKNCTYVR